MLYFSPIQSTAGTILSQYTPLMPPPSIQRIPWRGILLAVAVATVASWTAGFLAGLLLRLFLPAR